MPFSGECLCGAVRYGIDGNVSSIWLCHCSKCRRSSGSAFHAVAITRRSHFRWVSGEEGIREYRTPSGYTTRFYGTCGSPVPQVLDSGEQVVVLPGALDPGFGKPVVRHIFVGSKAPWWLITDDLPRFEEHAPGTRQPGSRTRP